MKLAKNFTLAELTFSQIATRHNIDNAPNKSQINNLILLANNILQPVRNHFQSVVIISSGYRCPQLNKLIGGASSSQHLNGEAADFEVINKTNYEVAEYIANNLTFDQLILEFYIPGQPTSGWVHCSYKNSNNRKEVLTINKNGTFKGLLK